MSKSWKPEHLQVVMLWVFGAIRANASCTSPWPLNQHVWLVGVAHAFGLVGHAKCNKRSVKSVRRRQSVRITLRVRKCEYIFELHNAKIWSFIKTTTHFIRFARCCCSLSYSLFSMRASRHWGCIYALSSPPFSRQAPSSFFLAPITAFAILTLWQWDR